MPPQLTYTSLIKLFLTFTLCALSWLVVCYFSGRGLALAEVTGAFA
jgi:hypothetical protein